MIEEIEKRNKRIRKSVINCISMLNLESKEVDRWTEDIIHAIADNQKQNEDLNEALRKLDLNFNEIKTNRDNTHRTLNEKNVEFEMYKAELAAVENAYNSLLKEVENLETECLKTTKKAELSSVDKNILDLSRKKFELYGQMTNIVWDYTVPLVAKVVSGYIKNKNYIHAFELKKNDVTPLEMNEKLWKEVEQGSNEDWSDIVNMTNIKCMPTEN